MAPIQLAVLDKAALLAITGTILLKSRKKIGKIIDKIRKKPNRFDEAFRKLSPKGKENVGKLRKWAKDNNYVKKKNSGGPEIWGVYDKNGKFSWRLRIKPEPSTREGLSAGSQKPRFDAKISDGRYHNPLTGKTGGKKIGTHINLE